MPGLCISVVTAWLRLRPCGVTEHCKFCMEGTCCLMSLMGNATCNNITRKHIKSQNPLRLSSSFHPDALQRHLEVQQLHEFAAVPSAQLEPSPVPFSFFPFLILKIFQEKLLLTN